MNKSRELERVLGQIEEAREAFPFDTSLISEEMLQGFACAFDCAASMACMQATNYDDGVEV